MMQINPPGRAAPPVIGVIYDVGSASLATLRAAAGRHYEIVFICDREIPHVAEHFSEAQRYARVLDVTGSDISQRIEAVRALSPAAVLTFSEYRLMEVALLCHALGLPGHSVQQVKLLTDKFAQRQRLAQAGVQETLCIELHPGQPISLPQHFSWPAVLKPRSGAGSLNTVRVTSRPALDEALSQLPADRVYVLETYLAGDKRVAGEGWGDYVSVESLHSAQGSRQVCVTGKFPLASPFRETGMVLPATLAAGEIDAILTLEAAAIQALGITNGVTHSEIKLTASGPRIIEVNGRLGGYVPEILKRATGVNLVQCAFELALGREPRLPEICFNDRVYYQYFLTPPAAVNGSLRAVHGLDDIAAIDGVLQVESRAQAGDLFTDITGTQSLLGIVYGEAESHQALLHNVGLIDARFRPEFSQPGENALRAEAL